MRRGQNKSNTPPGNTSGKAKWGLGNRTDALRAIIHRTAEAERVGPAFEVGKSAKKRK